MGLFRKKSVAAKEAPSSESPATGTNTVVAASPPPLPARPVSPISEPTDTAVAAPPLASLDQPTQHTISTEENVHADQHQREVVARESQQQEAIDRIAEKEKEAFGGGAVAGGGLASEKDIYPTEKVEASSNGIVDDGMMRGFRPVEGFVVLSVPVVFFFSLGVELTSLSLALSFRSNLSNTSAAPADEKSNHHLAEGAAVGGLAGIGAAGAGGAFSHDGADRSAHSHTLSSHRAKLIVLALVPRRSLVENTNGDAGEKHLPAPIQTDLAASSPDSSLPNSAASPIANDAASPLSASALAKIHKAECESLLRLSSRSRSSARETQTD